MKISVPHSIASIVMCCCIQILSLDQARFCALPNLLLEQGQFHLTQCSSNLTATFSVKHDRKRIYGFKIRFAIITSCFTVQLFHFNDKVYLSDTLAPQQHFLHQAACLFFPHLKIEMVENYALENAPNLTSVSFRYNHIREIKPYAFVNNSKLIKLDLGDNRIVDLPRDVFQSLSKLRVLQLSNNGIIQLNAEAFRFVRNLRILHLANNSLRSDLQSAPFLFLTDLKELSLKDNLISIISSSAFNGLSNLRQLNLRRNNLSEVNTGCFLNLIKLKQLDVGENAFLRLAPMRQFASTGSLGTLHLDDTPELIYDSAWLDSVPLDCSIIVSQCVYNCFLSERRHPLRNYRSVFLRHGISNASLPNKVCLFRTTSTSIWNASYSIISGATSGGLFGVICLALCVYVLYRQIKRHCSTFMLQQAPHSSKNQLCEINMESSNCSINSMHYY